MRRRIWLCLAMVTGLLDQSFAQQGGSGARLNETEQLGRRLLEQSCGVCHSKPTLTSPLFGPQLSKQTLNGNADALREVISNGTPRMPGFKHHFQSAQIDAIIAYLKTLPAPPPEGVEPVSPNAPRVQDN